MQDLQPVQLLPSTEIQVKENQGIFLLNSTLGRSASFPCSLMSTYYFVKSSWLLKLENGSLKILVKNTGMQ